MTKRAVEFTEAQEGSPVEHIATALADQMQAMVDAGATPFDIADAAVIAGASWWCEVCGTTDLAKVFETMAKRFAAIHARRVN